MFIRFWMRIQDNFSAFRNCVAQVCGPSRTQFNCLCYWHFTVMVQLLIVCNIITWHVTLMQSILVSLFPLCQQYNDTNLLIGKLPSPGHRQLFGSSKIVWPVFSIRPNTLNNIRCIPNIFQHIVTSIPRFLSRVSTASRAKCDTDMGRSSVCPSVTRWYCVQTA